MVKEMIVDPAVYPGKAPEPSAHKVAILDSVDSAKHEVTKKK